MKNFFKFLFTLFFAICFFIPIIIYIVQLPETNNKINIAKNGIEIEATVTSIVKVGDDEDETPRYRILYKFVVEGQTYFGKTAKTYSRSYAYNAREIFVKYNEKFESVESDYTGPETWPFFIFGGISLGAFALFLYFVIDAVIVKRISVSGKDGEGNYMGHMSNVRVNGRPLFCVKYYWIKENGENISVKSPSNYTFEQAQYYNSRGKFKIKTRGKRSVIVEKPFEIPISNTQQVEGSEISTATKCLYCGSVVDSSLGQCTSCGAPFKKEKHK